MNHARDINREAADWFARLDAHAPTDADRAEFAAWLAADPRHHVAFRRMEILFSRSSCLQRMRDTRIGPAEAPAGADGTIRSHANSSRRRWFFAAMAASLILGVALYAFSNASGRTRGYATGADETRTLALSDGSIVNLNRDSAIEVRFSRSRRDVTLVHGQAHFTVAHDTHRPFYVDVGRTTVRAVGTAFAVRRRSDGHADVVVANGVVAISESVSTVSAGEGATGPAVDPVTSISVHAGEIAAIDQGKITVKKADDETISQAVDWAQTRLWFERITLTEAAARFNRYNTRQLIVADPVIANARFGGGFIATDIDSFVQAIERTCDIRADTSDPQAIRLYGVGAAPGRDSCRSRSPEQQTPAMDLPP